MQPVEQGIALCDARLSAETAQAVCATALPDGAPEWVHLLTLGAIHSRDGRKFNLKDAAVVVAQSMSDSIDPVIDYGHQTDYAKDNGAKALAAGWIKEMEVRADGVWARVEWTDQGRAHLSSREYRYLSPTFLHKKSGEIIKILRAALTNDPALHLTALAAKQHEDIMDEFLKAILAALGLPVDTDQDKALAQVVSLVSANTANGELITGLCQALDLDKDAKADDIATAVASLQKPESNDNGGGKPDPAKFAPIGVVEDLQKQVATLTIGRDEDKATEAVEKAMAEGKISPAMKDWAIDLATQDMDRFKSFAEKQPVIVSPSSQSGITGTPPRTGGAMSGEEKAVCAQLGLSQDDFKKTREQEIAQ